MPKKKKGGDSGINMDVMMDSMTNVVGTLLLILIVVQIQISSAVESIETVLKNITDDDIKALKAKIAKQNENIDGVDVAKLNEDYKKLMGDVDEEQMRVNIYANEVKEKTNEGLLDVRELIEMKTDKQEAMEMEQHIFDDLSRERSRLEALLAKTPEPVIPTGADIIVPAGLPMPKNRKEIHIICRNNRLYYLQEAQYRQLAERMLEPRMQTVIYSNYMHPTTKKMVTIYDHMKSYKLLQGVASNLNSGNTNFTINTWRDDYQTRLRLRLVPDAKGGISLESLEERNNQLRKDLIRIKRDSRNILWFYVYKDSLDVYLKARDISQALGVAQGWEYRHWDFVPALKFPVNPLRKRTNRVSAVQGRKRASAVQIKRASKTLD